jgi:hypothetical protein
MVEKAQRVMAEPTHDDSCQRGAQSSDQSGSAADAERVQELTWALLDESITDEELAVLNQLLLGSNEARELYSRCVQLHADLSGEFGRPVAQPVPQPQANTPSPILNDLNTAFPPLNVQTPAEDSAI